MNADAMSISFRLDVSPYSDCVCWNCDSDFPLP